MYVGHYSEYGATLKTWDVEREGEREREREKQCRGKSIEIDVQKDQGLRESLVRGAERKGE